MWRRGKAHVTVKRVWQEEGRWTVSARFGNGTCAEMSAAEFLKQFRHVAEAPEPCCDLHGRICEPPSELCCKSCTEAAHPGHADGSACSAPDLSAVASG